ncbi:HNH endonuclease [Streptosporangium canum]|uniref:HNH endonuclease n=1 Tax=Streptosporangium canum TaxID=324952 RepID=UPI0033B0F894
MGVLLPLALGGALPRAKRICNESRCIAVEHYRGKCKEHQPKDIRKSWTRTSARNKSRPGDWKKRKRIALKRDNYRCYLCGRIGAGEVDHVLSVAKGGTHDVSNLRAICSVCHTKKSKRERYGM